MANHEQNRSLICALCLAKNKNVRTISIQLKEVIVSHFLADFELRENYYPSVLCGNCRIVCGQYAKGNFERKLTVHEYSFDKPICLNEDEICNCEICETVRAQTGLDGFKNFPKRKRGRPTVNEVPEKKVLRLCSACLSEIGRGKRHVCNTSERTMNISNKLKETEVFPKAAETAVSDFLRNKIGDAENDQITLSNLHGKPTIYQRKSTYNLRASKKVPATSVFQMKSENNLSVRKTLSVVKSFRAAGVQFEGNVRNTLITLNKQLQCLFDVAVLGDVAKSAQAKISSHCDVPIVYCTDVPKLIDLIREKRSTGSEPEDIIKLGIDGGGGFLKVTLNVIPKIDENVPSRQFKESGVKKLFIIALAPSLPEKYEFINLIWKVLLKLDQLDGYIAGDLKIINILVGIMAHSSAHPCPYCETSKKNLSSCDGRLRTIGNIKENLNNLPSCKSPKDNTNCVNIPLISGSDEQLILLVCPPPPLHLTLGIINCIFKSMEKINKAMADKWVDAAHVRHQQQTYGFTGRACHSLLNAVDVLKDHNDLDKFVDVLQSFQDVFRSCMSMELKTGFELTIEKFSKCWEILQLPQTSKFHIIKNHVKEFCLRTGHSLGVVNEQASESVHSNYTFTWERYKVPKTSKKYNEQLLRATIDYNSGHV